MAANTETLDPSSEWWEKCARHSARYTARTLQYIYLCDGCADRLVHEGLNHRPFVYHGETVDGFCGLCNAETSVTLRQHFACIPCWTLIGSYQKSIVASSAIHDSWRSLILPEFPTFRLDETEVIRVEPYSRKAKTKRQIATTLEILDFRVFEMLADGSEHSLFHIEQKAGPASIDNMTEFQLDVNDYEDIVGASCYTRLATYIFHVRILPEYSPPTRRIVPAGIWWTDVARLRANLKSVKGRRGEEKQAAYFHAKAFRPFELFASELRLRKFEEHRAGLDPARLALP